MTDILERGRSLELGWGGSEQRLDSGLLVAWKLPSLVERARWEARTNAYSYRGFHVGAAALFLVDGSALPVLSGANFKRQGDPKHCAEMAVLDAADESPDGFTPSLRDMGATMIGLVVVGTTDTAEIAEVSGHPTPTLHPCGECRDLLDAHPTVTPNTLVLTTGIDSDVLEVQNFGTLRAAYTADCNGPAPFALDAGFQEWQQRVQECPMGPASNSELPLPVLGY